MSVVRLKDLMSQIRQMRTKLDALEFEVADLSAAAEARRRLRAGERVVSFVAAKRYSRERNGVRAGRLLQGMSQSELAAKLRVSQSYVAAVESGRKRLGVKQARRIAHLLDCDFRDLLV